MEDSNFEKQTEEEHSDEDDFDSTASAKGGEGFERAGVGAWDGG